MIAIEDVDKRNKKDFIVDGLMRPRGVYLLVSQPKVGKSMLALQLSYSITNGSPFLGCKVNPSPVLYITTESDIYQLVERIDFMGLKVKDKSLYLIDRNDKSRINLHDIEDKFVEFSDPNKTKLLIIDMMKDFDIGVTYDINDFQDVAQKLMPKVRNIADKYNFTILLTHHLNKRKETLGSTGLDACVDGVITLIDKNDKKHIQFKSINRDFAPMDIMLEKDEHLILNVCEDDENDEILDTNLVSFIKYASLKKDFEFTPTDIVNRANLFCTPKKFGRILNSNIELLKEEGLYITKNRTSSSRNYHCHYEEPN